MTPPETTPSPLQASSPQVSAPQPNTARPNTAQPTLPSAEPNGPAARRGWVILDADDTLWTTQALYEDAKAEWARLLMSLSPALAARGPEALIRQLDQHDAARASVVGFGRSRFIDSCADVGRDLCAQAGLAFTPELEQRLRAAAEEVYRRSPVLVPGVHGALQALRSAGWPLVMLTKGDRAVQEERVERSGLREFVDEVRIVDHKTTQTFRDLCLELGADPAQTWSVGNSSRSDVNPSVEAGLRGLLVPAGGWAYEEAALDPRAEQRPSLMAAAARILEG